MFKMFKKLTVLSAAAMMLGTGVGAAVAAGQWD